MRKVPDRARQDFSCLALCFLPHLPHLLADDPTDGIGGILLHLGRGMGVGVQCATCRVVAQRARQRFDPRRDPRTEKPGRKQWSGEYLRVMKIRGKPALFSRNPAEDIPIESSHA